MAEDKILKDKKNYKFKALNVYASTEWLANNQKKYRQVFSASDSTYIYAELAFYNKLFDDKAWTVDVQLICFELGKKKKICSLKFNKKVNKTDNLVHVREGWGNKKKGSFWKKGTYYWEAWIDGEKVSTKYFYVENYGPDINQFWEESLELTSMRLYEGSFEDVNETERNYLKVFSSEITRYIYSELNFKKKSLKTGFNVEVFIKFYNQARELKGQVSKLVKMSAKDEIIKTSLGWGSNNKGSWRNGKYTAELVTMDRLLAIIPFEICLLYTSPSPRDRG